MRVSAVREKPSLTGEFVGETHRVLECTQTHPPRNQHQKGSVCLWVVEKVTDSWPRAEEVALFPFGPFPHMQHHSASTWVALPWQIPRLHPLILKRCTETKKKKKEWPNERTDQSSRKNTTKQ